MFCSYAANPIATDEAQPPRLTRPRLTLQNAEDSGLLLAPARLQRKQSREFVHTPPSHARANDDTVCS